MKAFSIMVVVSVILAVQQTCNAEGQGRSLEVKIVATYDPPSSFSKHLLFYRAGSPLTLTCEVEEVDEEEVIYEWTSTCSGSCFVRGGTTKTVSTRYLHSYDSGVHTCAVHTHSYTGNATIIVSVVGAGIYIESTDTVLSNNSLISTSELHQNIPSFRCLSGSSQSHVGRLIDPLGNDITFSTSDPFFISRGGKHNPGTLYIRSLREFEPTDSGIYIYRTPDENENFVDVNVGLYHYTTSSAPILLDFLFSQTESPYIFTCVSSLSPPTEVIWEVDGERIYFNDSYSDYDFTQTLVNCTTSTYYNTLSVNGTIDDVIGEYSCTVVNSLGSSNTLTKTIKVLEVSGHEDPLIVGLSRRISCKTYLNVTKMEWLLEGIVYPVEKRDDGGQELVMTLDPKNTDLDGTMFTCRIITARGITLEEAIIINVRELEHSVSITGPPNPLLASGKYSLNCTVISDFTPTVQWLDPNNQVIITTGTSVRTDSPVTNGNTAQVVLHFDSIHISHGGTYTCTSTVSKTGSFKKETRDLQVQITASNVTIVHSQTAFVSEPLDLTCITFFDQSVNIPVYVTHEWTTPSGVVTTERGNAITGSYQQYRSTLSFSSLQSNDSGTYICASTVNDSLSEYVTSDTMFTGTLLNTTIRVIIEVTYSPPDQYPDYSPPNYRAASSVTLRCVAIGATGYLSYRWSSTCPYGCFAYSTTAQTISENMLRSRDAGVHTCTVADEEGSTGTNSTTMNIVGAGIYVVYSRGTGTSVNSQTAQPNNSYAIVDTRGYYSGSSYRFEMYCCSNSSSSRASFTLPNNRIISYNYRNIRYRQYTGGDTYAGCARFYYDYYYYSHLNFPGIYTCNIGDSRGNNIAVNIGLYSEGFNNLPSINQLRQINTGTDLKLICRSNMAPPTNITWFRNDEVLDIDGNNTKMTLFVGERSWSYFDSILTIRYDFIDSVVGTYTCQTANEFGISSEEIVIQDIRVIIEITYSPPDQYPDYSPPNYRAATSVTLRCVAIGSTGYVSYQWSSTCQYDCFANNATTQTISENMLRSRDAGVHTCTVTDGVGNTGTNSTTMNIVGAGIYVIYSLGTGTSVNSQTSQPNNSYAIVDTGGSNRGSNNRFEMFCCSNSSSPGAHFILPYHYIISGNYGNIRYRRYTGSHTYAGCIQFYYYTHYNNYLYIDTGVYTCNIGDSRGNNIAVSIGLYSEGFNSLPSINQLRQTNTGTDLKLICTSNMAPPTNITWFKNDEVLDIDGHNTKMTLFGWERSWSYFNIILTIMYDSIDSVVGTYTCQTANEFGISSREIMFQDIRVTIEITYSPPDQYPDYSPPNYRAASSVTLRCVATGATGYLSYRWSSTCPYGCFAYNTRAQTISKNMLTSHDAGVHTCTVTDGSGNTGTNSITMNIVGAGIYVVYSLGTGTSVNSQTAQPNNSYAIVDTGRSYRHSRYRFDMYCCSNSSSSRAIITLPNNVVNIYSYGYYQYTGGDTYAGCTRFYYDYYYRDNFHLNYPGVHIFNIGDSRGNNIALSIGLYSEGFRALPSISLIQQVNSGTDHTAKFIITSQTVPPTNIIWFRNDEILDINGNSTEMTVSVTNRRHSYFDIALSITYDSPDSVIGTYTCQTANNFGIDSEKIEFQDMQIQCSSNDEFIVGQNVECSCTSYLDPIFIEWYQGNTSLQQSFVNTVIITIPVTTDNEGSVFTCLMTSFWGTYQKMLILNTTVPYHWADVYISTSKGSALHGSEYTLECTVSAVTGMTLPPSVEWVGPDGTVLESEENVTIGEVETRGTISTFSLSFNPVLSSHGGHYTCRATVNVSWMDVQPPQLSTTFNMVVTTQAIFQLKLYPLSHCTTWRPWKAGDMGHSIKRKLFEILREHCQDYNNFNYYDVIHSGGFSCPDATCQQSNCSLVTHATYRAIINGRSDLLTADQLMNILKEWHDSTSSLLVNDIRLKVARSKKCKLSISSFDEEEC